MADGFDTSKSKTNTASDGFNPQGEKNTGGDTHRTSYNSLWRRQPSNDGNNQVYSPSPQQSQSSPVRKFLSFGSTSKSPTKQTGSFDYHTQTPLQEGLTTGSQQSEVHIIESERQPYWESGEYYTEDWNQGQIQGTEYGAAGYSQEEYYSYEKQYKKKGLSFKVDRFVGRFPALGIFYKQPLSSPYRSRPDHNYIDPNQLTRELTADELSLNQRYSDKTCAKLINLEVKDQTQPVDLRIHHDTNQIYLCDVGRSIVEIYNIDGTHQHVIDNPMMLKFQPTALAVGCDGTIILASHFNHCLHMYSPSDSQNTANRFSYKQFKFGAQGDQIHQFDHPAGIAIDHNDGCLYVCDRGNYRIQVIRPEGMCERMIKLYLNTRKKKCPLDPIRVAIQKNSDYLVCIIGAGDAICFIPKDTDGSIYVDPLYIFDENGLGLEGASGLATDAHDRIYISDTVHNRIVICTPEGGYITSFGTEGDGIGQLKRPCGLDLTDNGTIVVADPGNKRLQLFGLIHDQQQPVENKPPEEKSTATELDLISSL